MSQASQPLSWLPGILIVLGGSVLLNGLLSGGPDRVGGIVFGVVALAAAAAILYRRARDASHASSTDWYELTTKYHELTFAHDARLSSLPEEWQRELAALWRLEADVNNGAYLQFLGNWGHESYVYASQALKKIGARKMAEIIDQCQALVDEHIDAKTATREQLQNLMPNTVVGADGGVVKAAGTILPDVVVERIYELSYAFMKYPDDIAKLGWKYYQPYAARG